MHQNEQIDKLLVSVGVGVGVGSFVVIIVVSVNYKTYIFKFVIGNFCVKIAIHQKQNISGYCLSHRESGCRIFETVSSMTIFRFTIVYHFKRFCPEGEHQLHHITHLLLAEPNIAISTSQCLTQRIERLTFRICGAVSVVVGKYDCLSSTNFSNAE